MEEVEKEEEEEEEEGNLHEMDIQLGRDDELVTP